MDTDLNQFNPIFTTTATIGAGGLTRYKSAPSSYFTNFVMEYKDVSDFLRPPPTKPLSPQIDSIFAQLASVPLPPVMKLEIQPQSDHVSTSSASSYTPSSSLPPPHPLSRTTSGANKIIFPSQQVRVPVVEKQSTAGAVTNTLSRRNSLPSGLFSTIDVHNVTAPFYNGGGVYANQSEIRNERMKQSIAVAAGTINSEDEVLLDDYMVNGFWNDAVSTEKLLIGVKRERADENAAFDVNDVKPFSNINEFPQAVEMKKSGLLSHHLSLPKSSMEMLSAMEKFLDLQDSTVPVGVRAKRGCATHPRSIAERVRRTKISERMRRLQELVPNMDKQTNTSDMLDLAVDYIKDLQQRVQLLKASRDRCTC